MKLNKNSKKYTLIGAIIIIIFGLISVVAVWQLTDRDELVGQPKSSSEKVAPVADSQPESATISLPGATSITPIDGDYSDDAHIWRLVNKSNPLNDIDYRPEIIKPNVNTRQDKSLDEQSVRADIAAAVEALFATAKSAGHELQIGSGFRSSSLQNTYYTNYSRVYGQAAADRVSAKPGYSEHQTGLAIDLTTPDHHCYLEACFGETEAGQWLRDHAHESGFILRYPKNKEGITDFNYEPWHFRYVGIDLATALYQSGLTLDEAAPYLSNP